LTPEENKERFDSRLPEARALVKNEGFEIVRAANADDLNPENLIQKNFLTCVISYYDSNNPGVLGFAGLNSYQQQVRKDDVESADPSAVSTLKDKGNAFASLANVHHKRMVAAVEAVGGNLSEPIFCLPDRNIGSGIKCISHLVDGVNDEGEQVTYEHCWTSMYDRRALAASAGERRLSDSIARMNYFLDPPSNHEQRAHVKAWYNTRIHGQSALNNSDLMIFVCKPLSRRTEGTVVEVCRGPRFNTAPGK